MLFDTHAHLAAGTDSLNRLLSTMNSLEIKKCIVVGGGLVPARRIHESADPTEAMKITFDHLGMLGQCAESQGRLLPFYFANPWIAPEEYLRLGESFYGLKLGPAVHGVPLSSPRTMVWVEAARALRHIVYLHCLDRDGFRVSELCTLALRFPSISFILGHGGIGHLDYSAVDLIAPHSNISFETSGAFKAVVQYACSTLGAQRVLFGSEYPLQSAACEIAKIRDLALNRADLEAVAGRNIEELIGRAR